MKNSLHTFVSFMAAAVLLLSSTKTIAQEEVTTVGTDFWLGFMSNYENQSEGLFLFLSSNEEAQVTVSMPNYGLSQDFTVIPGEVTTVEVPDLAEHTQSEIVDDKGVHIVSDVPISAYCINFQGFTADGTRLLPTRFLGTDYVAIGYEGLSPLNYLSEFLVVATEDDTEIEITPSCDLLNGSQAGVPFTVQLDQGDSYQGQAAISSLDITGTTIQATEASGDCRPFAVFGGSECPNIPNGCGFCDHVFDQNLPLGIWETEYLIVPWLGPDRYSGRVLAAQDSTEYSIDGVLQPILNAGEYQTFTGIEEASFIQSNHPIYVVQYMEGTSCAGTGDPAMCSINGNGQTLEQITFATVISNVIDSHNMNVIVPTDASSQVFLDGVLIDAGEFTPFPGLPERSYARLSISEGSHTVNCDAGFIAYSYGSGQAESYAYSTGAGKVNPPVDVIEGVCGDGEVVLAGEQNYFEEWWTTQSEPNDTLSTEETLIITPPIETDIYVLNGFDFVSGCLSQEFFSVESTDPLLVGIVEDTVELCLFQQYTFDPAVEPASPAYVYDWSIPSAFVESEAEDGVIQPFQSGYYFLDVSTLNECAVGTDSVYVDVIGGDAALQDISVNPEVVCEGDTVFLSAEVISILGFDSFDDGLGPLIIGAAGASFDNVCAAYGSAALHFDGDINRFANTDPLDVSLGGTVSFALLISDGSSGCDATEVGENVLLEYSLNGTDWFTIQTFNENAFAELTDVEVAIPVAAWSPNTIFRWIQPVFSGPDEDIWVLDNVFITSNGAPNANYLWSSDQVIDDAAAQSTFSVPLADATYSLALGTDACQFTASQDVQLDSDIEILGPSDFCEGESVELEVDGEYQNVIWSTGANENSISVDEPGTYGVSILSFGGCEFEDEVLLSLTASPQAILTDTIICQDPAPILLFPAQSSVNQFSWSTGDTTATIEVDADGIYYVELSNDCFVITDSMMVDYVSFEEDNLDDIYEICLGDSLILSVPSLSADITWSNGVTSDTAVFFLANTYGVTLSENGCDYVESFEIAYVDYVDTDEISLPNVITPNEDGENDLFQPFLPGTENTRMCNLETFDADLEIFNRWGILISSGGCTWNGRAESGELVNEGVYFYIADMKSQCQSRESRTTRKGTVQVLK